MLFSKSVYIGETIRILSKVFVSLSNCLLRNEILATDIAFFKGNRIDVLLLVQSKERQREHFQHIGSFDEFLFLSTLKSFVYSEVTMGIR
ncbi:hypothetical protein RCL_jg22570.t1 [Rhizophagus clarus]|uniref:Uncharacterized protein n=1 Tax=Rhizophagus clarus TaxID=94130 RepID=A0A8H3MF68_9GLOM|nr:hypothetical protein RCL_jg22570.t1 [Rhizophagus clarus]